MFRIIALPTSASSLNGLFIAKGLFHFGGWSVSPFWLIDIALR